MTLPPGNHRVAAHHDLVMNPIGVHLGVIIRAIGQRADDGQVAGGIARGEDTVVIHIANDGAGASQNAVGFHFHQRGGQGAIDAQQAAYHRGVGRECAVAGQVPAIRVAIPRVGLNRQGFKVVEVVHVGAGALENQRVIVRAAVNITDQMRTRLKGY